MEKLTDCSKLINEASRILEHQKEISTLKGENFNIFSILRMESKENATHSAFLGELLNPEGSHNFGSTFLKLFLDLIDDKIIDIESAKVKLEHFVGARNDKEKTGGRVDIYIWDKNDSSICIENKIYAPDQNVQIQRYCNYGKNNSVYYLTLEGDEPSDNSKGDLTAGEDFQLLSYSSDILEWLSLCAKEACHFPIIRESIQQYIILLKKLTNQLTDNKMSKDIHKLIADNYATTKTLASNLKLVEAEYARLLLSEIKFELDKVLQGKWQIDVDDDLWVTWSGLKIKHMDWPEKVFVKLEGQSRVPWNDSVYGIIANKDIYDREVLYDVMTHIDFLQGNGFRSSNGWPYYMTILHFSNDESRAVLFDNKLRKELALDLAEKLLEIAKACEEPLKKVHKIDKVEGTEASLN